MEILRVSHSYFPPLGTCTLLFSLHSTIVLCTPLQASQIQISARKTYEEFAKYDVLL